MRLPRISHRSQPHVNAPRRAALHRTLAILAATAAICSLFTAGFVVLIGATQAAASTSGDATMGALAPVGTFDPLHPPAAASTTRPATSHTRGAHRLPTLTGQASATSNSAPSGAGSFDDRETGALLHNFNGVGSLDSAVTNFGAEFEPPDQGLCIGNGFVVEPVNSAFTIYRPNGAVVVGPLNVNVLFGEGLTEFTSDPRCHYDKATNTWFATILFISGGGVGNSSRTDIAVNASGDPTTPWTVYHIDTTEGNGHLPHHQGCPCFGDQPRLGLDQENLYISTDEFSILGPQFNGTQLYAISKSELIAGAQTVRYAHFGNLSIGGAIAGGVQPAITFGASNAEYFLGSLDPTGTTDNRLGVWALTDRDNVSHGDLPTLSKLVIGSQTYGVPPGGQQKGASSLLDAGDDRMQQVQFINGQLWGALDTVVTIPGDATARAGLAWFAVEPRLGGNTLASAAIAAQGYVAVRGAYLLYPAIAVDNAGNAAMALTITSASLYASAAYTTLGSDRSSFGAIHIVGHGTGPYDPTATRWGDYSWAILDPDSDSFWMATEYIPPAASQTTDGLRNWGTRVFAVAAGE